MIRYLLFGRGAISRRLRFDGWSVRLQWRPRDLWVGVYWVTDGHCLDAWVCLLPCLPVHVSAWWHDPGQ